MLFGEQDVKQSDCNKKGQFWLEGKKGEFLCFYLTRPKDSHDCSNNDPKTVRALQSSQEAANTFQCVGDAWQAPYDDNNMFDTGIYDKLTNTYGFDLKVWC